LCSDVHNLKNKKSFCSLVLFAPQRYFITTLFRHRRWLDEAVADAPASTNGIVRGIIAPHAGYSYSGPTAAHAYKNVDATG
jgi:AmmeMemoRadiSam system protein B